MRRVALKKASLHGMHQPTRSLLMASTIAAAACASPSTPAPANPSSPAAATIASAPSATASAPSPSVNAIPFDLPRASEVAAQPLEPELRKGATSQPMTPMLSVTIPKAGAWLVNGRAIASHDDLLRIAREALASDPAMRAVIQADAEARWGDVVRAIDLLKQGGIAKLAFAVSPIPPPNPQAPAKP